MRLEQRAVVIAGLCLALLASCSGKRPPEVGIGQVGLAPCPLSPNCVSSEAAEPSQHVEPLFLVGPPGRAWAVIGETVAGLPRTKVVQESPTRLHAECRSAVFRFVDDLELELRAKQGLVAVRSASRVGYSDMGVNRRRVEGLRDELRLRGVVR